MKLVKGRERGLQVPYPQPNAIMYAVGVSEKILAVL